MISRNILNIPPLKPIIPTKKHDDHAGYLHRQVIGYLGMLLPLALWAIARNRPMTGLTNGDLLTSMSAYYYTGATAVFTGILAALAVYLFTYTGYGNGAALWDRGMAWVAGAAAVGVALYPTGAPVKALELLWWTEPTGTVHGVAASILFVDFALMSFFLFTKTDPKIPKDTDKNVRNAIYRFCGIAMLVCIAWAGNNQFLSDPKKPIFLPEALTLVLFAFSWLTKGRADKSAGRLLHRAWHYARNREQLKADYRETIRRMKSPPKRDVVPP